MVSFYKKKPRLEKISHPWRNENKVVLNDYLDIDFSKQ